MPCRLPHGSQHAKPSADSQHTEQHEEQQQQAHPLSPASPVPGAGSQALRKHASMPRMETLYTSAAAVAAKARQLLHVTNVAPQLPCEAPAAQQHAQPPKQRRASVSQTVKRASWCADYAATEVAAAAAGGPGSGADMLCAAAYASTGSGRWMGGGDAMPDDEIELAMAQAFGVEVRGTHLKGHALHAGAHPPHIPHAAEAATAAGGIRGGADHGAGDDHAASYVGAPWQASAVHGGAGVLEGNVGRAPRRASMDHTPATHRHGPTATASRQRLAAAMANQPMGSGEGDVGSGPGPGPGSSGAGQQVCSFKSLGLGFGASLNPTQSRTLALYTTGSFSEGAAAGAAAAATAMAPAAPPVPPNSLAASRSTKMRRGSLDAPSFHKATGVVAASGAVPAAAAVGRGSQRRASIDHPGLALLTPPSNSGSEGPSSTCSLSASQQQSPCLSHLSTNLSPHSPSIGHLSTSQLSTTSEPSLQQPAPLNPVPDKASMSAGQASLPPIPGCVVPTPAAASAQAAVAMLMPHPPAQGSPAGVASLRSSMDSGPSRLRRGSLEQVTAGGSGPLRSGPLGKQ